MKRTFAEWLWYISNVKCNIIEYDIRLLSVDYLMKLHPELNENQATNLLEFSISKTIKHKKCYGDGRIMLPLWKQSLV